MFSNKFRSILSRHISIDQIQNHKISISFSTINVYRKKKVKFTLFLGTSNNVSGKDCAQGEFISAHNHHCHSVNRTQNAQKRKSQETQTKTLLDSSIHTSSLSSCLRKETRRPPKSEPRTESRKLGTSKPLQLGPE